MLVDHQLHYIEIKTHDQLMQLKPAFVRSLAEQLDVLSLRGRVCPVSFSDNSVGVFTLIDYCHDDQTRALLSLLVARGFRLNRPHLFVLPAALLLAIDRSTVERLPVSSAVSSARQLQQGALATAFDDLLRWGIAHQASDIHFNVNRNQ